MNNIKYCKRHKTCREASKNNVTGVAVLLLNNYHDKNNDTITPVLLFGKERFGRYAGSYNTCAGKLEKKNNYCVIQAAMEEITEETAISCRTFAKFDKLCKDKETNKLRKFIFKNSHASLTVFVAHLHSLNIFKDKLNAKLKENILNKDLPKDYKEIDRVDWFKLYDLTQLEGKDLPVTNFTKSLVATAKIKDEI